MTTERWPGHLIHFQIFTSNRNLGIHHMSGCTSKIWYIIDVLCHVQVHSHESQHCRHARQQDALFCVIKFKRMSKVLEFLHYTVHNPQTDQSTLSSTNYHRLVFVTSKDVLPFLPTKTRKSLINPWHAIRTKLLPWRWRKIFKRARPSSSFIWLPFGPLPLLGNYFCASLMRCRHWYVYSL